jgi:POT family proton-dependent oligopeptide transporter
MSPTKDNHQIETAQALGDPSVFDETASEHANLRRVPGRIPWFLFIICIVEVSHLDWLHHAIHISTMLTHMSMQFGERFVYLGPLQNYIQRPYRPGSGIPGALGKGQSVGVALGDFFKFWSYFCVFGGAIVADQYLGKYRTILAASPIYISGLVILVVTSAPFAITANASMGGLVTAMVLIGVGTGGLKACIAPLCGEQTTNEGKHLRTLKSGEVVVVDPALTTARVFMWYYWAANIGGLSSLMTVAIEKEASFWLAYLLPLL